MANDRINHLCPDIEYSYWLRALALNAIRCHRGAMIRAITMDLNDISTLAAFGVGGSSMEKQMRATIGGRDVGDWILANTQSQQVLLKASPYDRPSPQAALMDDLETELLKLRRELKRKADDIKSPWIDALEIMTSDHAVVGLLSAATVVVECAFDEAGESQLKPGSKKEVMALARWVREAWYYHQGALEMGAAREHAAAKSSPDWLYFVASDHYLSKRLDFTESKEEGGEFREGLHHATVLAEAALCGIARESTQRVLKKAHADAQREISNLRSIRLKRRERYKKSTNNMLALVQKGHTLSKEQIDLLLAQRQLCSATFAQVLAYLKVIHPEAAGSFIHRVAYAASGEYLQAVAERDVGVQSPHTDDKQHQENNNV